MSNSLRLLVAIAMGILLGLGGAHATFLGTWTLIPWGIVAVVLGWGVTWPGASAAGAAYGFVLVVTFMIAVYTGAEPVSGKLGGFSVLGCVGAICGGVLAAAASWVSTRVRIRR